MAQIKRYLEEKILQDLEKRKIVLIYGARQVGKTTLVKKFLDLSTPSLYLNGDFIDDRERLKAPTRATIGQFAALRLLIIDEAQNIPEIGLKLKLLYDTLPNICIIATGSSSFELSNKASEPLTGRHSTHEMFPIAACEESRFSLDQALVYGMYPEVFVQISPEEKRRTIERIASSYLFKDVLNIEYIKNPKSLEHLLRALASQVGNEVSAHELSNTLDLDTKTVAKYLDILEKLFIVFPLYPLASNVRKSITKKKKYYFYDVGIRNAVLGDFSSLEGRQDKGAVWENFAMVERMKANAKNNRTPSRFFFRTYKGEEIDLIEKYNNDLQGFECKYTNQAKVGKKIQKIYQKDLGGKNDVKIISRETMKKLFF